MSSHLRFLLSASLLAIISLTARGQSDHRDRMIDPSGNIAPSFYSSPENLSATSELISLARKQHYYSWENNTWQELIYSEFNYGEDDSCDTLLNFRGTGGDTINRVSYTYYPSGKLKSLKVESYTGGWMNTSFTSYNYDQYGNQTERSFYIWLGPSMQLASGTRNEYVFDQQTRIAELRTVKYNVVSAGWTDSTRQVYFYSLSDLPESITWLERTPEGWAEMTRFADIVWNRFDHLHATGEYLSYERQVWDENEWMSESRRNYSYGELGSYSYIEEIYFADEWTNRLRYYLVNTAPGYPEEEYTEEWLDGQWIRSDGHSWEYQFSGIDLEEVTEQEWIADSGYVNSTRITYEDFIHYELVPEIIKRDALAVYPNPFTDHLRISLPYEKDGRVIIADITGRVLWSASPGAKYDGLVIGTTSWPQGMYVVMWIREGGEINSKKLIKLIRSP